MCNYPDCMGDPHAPSKFACRACTGVKYRSEQERTDEGREWYADKKMDKVLKMLTYAVRAVCFLYRCKVPAEQVYAIVDNAGDSRASAYIRSIYNG